MKRKAVTLQLEGEIPQSQSAYDLAVEEGYEGNEEQYGKELATIPPTQEQFDAIPGRLSKLTTTTDKSDFHHITDSAADSVLDFGMEGKTEQKSTSGKNLWNAEYARDVNNWSKVEGSNYPSIPVFVGAGNVITVSYKQQLAGGLGFYFAISRDGMHNNLYDWMYHPSTTSLNTNETTFTAESDYIYPCYYEQKNLDLVMQHIGNDLQIEISPVATTYEPYTNGPSPNPDYPQEIVNAGVYNEATGRYEHRFRLFGKNIVSTNPNDWKRPGNYFRSKLLLYAKSDSLYITASITTKDSTNYPPSKIGFGLYSGASPKTWCSAGTDTYRTDLIDCIYLYAGLTVEEFLENYEVQVEYGSEVTDYEPYIEQPFTLTSPVPLTKWDYLTKRDGVWGWSIWSKNRQLDASHLDYTNTHGWSEFTDANTPEGVTTFVISMFDKAYGFANIYCDTFRMKPSSAYSKDAEKNTCSGISSGYRIFFSTDGLTMDEWKTYIDENPLNIWYQTAEEQSFHPLPDEEQELLKNLETYYGVTNLYNDQGCPMWLTYVQDTKTAVDNKFNNIKQALLSLGANV